MEINVVYYTYTNVFGGVMMELSLYKMHGSKNTFYLLDIETMENLPYIELTKWLCQQDNNDGADGLLIVLPSDKAQAKMRVINADGSEASMCGNGLRCVARYVCERDHLEEAYIETMKVTLHVSKEPDMLPNIPTYSVEIAPVSFNLSTLPMSYYDRTEIQNELLQDFSDSILFTAISVPNPHLIGIVDKYYIEHSSHQLLLARHLNNDSSYTPDGVNVSYVYPLSNDEVFVRTFERGVGFTNACGTAMTASALVAYKNNYVTSPLITVYNPGGFVKCKVEIDKDFYNLRLIGNATYMQQLNIYADQSTFSISYLQNNNEVLIYDESIEPVINKVKQCIAY